MRHEHLTAVHDAAVHWLTESGVRAADGSYRSIYDVARRSYADFYPMDSCMLSTAGAVVVLGAAEGRVDLALQSAERVCELVVEDDPRLAGALRAGRGGERVLSNWNLFAVKALLEARRLSGRDAFLEVAVRAADFVVDRMQARDGSIQQESRCDSRLNPVRRLLLPPHTWEASCVEPLFALSDATGDPRYRAAAERYGAWLLRLLPAEGLLPMYRGNLVQAALKALRNRDLAELTRGCPVAHPTSNAYAIDALVRLGHVGEAREMARRLAARLGPNGLLYQFYYLDGTHSVEEDTMPTAYFALVLLEHPELEPDPALLERIAEGVAYAQIRSDDPDAHGAMRGIPLHPESGENAYTWDTMFSVLFLRRLLGAAPA